MTTSPLLALPRELRDMIWGFALEEDPLEPGYFEALARGRSENPYPYPENRPALPRELRDMISRYALEEDPLTSRSSTALAEGQSENPHPENRPFTTVKALLDHLPALCHTSSQVFEETTPFFLSNQTIVLNNTREIVALVLLLKCIPNEGFNAIRRLQLGGENILHRWRGANIDFTILQLFPKLEAVFLDISKCCFEELFEPATDYWYVLLYLDRTSEKLNLNGLFECTLKEVVVVHDGRGNYSAYLNGILLAPGATQVEDDAGEPTKLAHWIQSQFKEKGREVKATTGEAPYWRPQFDEETRGPTMQEFHGFAAFWPSN
ncbi:uncharacterized protein BDZ99DRAFT_478787 [Mytilinidion resinicola]|uniref:Uncharacterized protein n=1 Tax=Mytilinidion resinicola TaxID=574789 RepID=A0A6A6YGZ1_9PEZI|nr:uncharacterized protein BDZ99DRAFT_478787 [Mytilinidion resinicola]KAF2807285.1 hypothetical protein BDZ99DRAFT_478787 [Mytilinidion resinicola]